MRIQLIQQKVPIGSQVTFTMKTGEKMSGSLTELGKDYVALDVLNGQAILDVKEIEGIHLGIYVDESDSSVSSVISLTTSEDPEDIPLPTEANPKLGDNQILSTPDGIEPVVEQESPDVAAVSTEVFNSSEDSSISVEEPENSDSIGIQTDFVDPEEQLDEIEKRFKNEIESANIELQPPDFTFPADELKGWQNTSIAGKWLQIKNTFKNAERINELSTKFGRIQPLLSELTSLVRRFPNSPSLKRVTAYFNAVSDDWQEAIQIYKEVAITSKDFIDWFNVAVSALNLNEEEFACYSLERFFNGVSVIDKPNAWYIYVNLVEKFNNLSAFRDLCKIDENDVAENEIEILLDTAIYLFKRKVTTELAIEIVQKRIKGEPAVSLLKEVSAKLGGQSVESFRQFLEEFMNERIASEEKDNSIHLGYSEPFGNTKAPTRDVTLQKPYSRPTVKLTGEELYRKAQRADKIDKNLAKAEKLFRECIRQNIRYDSAIKDLAMVLVRLDRSLEAVELLEKYRPDVEDKQSLDNTLIMVYPTADQYEKAIDLLNNSLKLTSEREKRAHIHSQISSNYIKLGNYSNAEKQFREVLKLRPNNITVQRNLALCLSKQDRYTEAEEILNRIQNISPNAKTAELLEAIEKAKATGEFILDDDSFIPTPSDFSGELSEFAHFFLKRCEFEGLESNIIAQRVQDGKYTGSEKDVKRDIDRLRVVSSKLGPSSPRERSNYNLSAARIYFDIRDNRDSFYQDLCRSFASRGDAAVIENRDLDAARGWYCEALTVYDGARIHHGNDEIGSLVKDADGSLVRYLYSILGAERIPRPPKIPSVSTAVSDVICTESEKVFDAIVYLVSHSGYASEKILRCLYENTSLRSIALKYLEKKVLDHHLPVKGQSDFIQLWNDLRHNQFGKAHSISNGLRVLQTFEISVAWLEDNIKHIENIRTNLFFELDKQRIAELRRIFYTALELCQQKVFGEQEYRCKLLDRFCEDLLGQIEMNPTKFSVEDVYPLIDVIHQKVKEHLEGLYETLKPQLTLRLAEGKESCVPVDRRIEVQIVVENEEGRMPADALKLVAQADESFFEVTVPDVELAESLRGGKDAQTILKVPLRLTDAALQSEAFSLPIYAEYGIRGGKRDKTPVQNLSVRLNSEDAFEKIANPYARFAEGGVVGDAEMFFGRDELIQNISKSIKESHFQSKSVVVFGQKRSGKSSVLYHLKKSLQEDKNLLILDLENIAAILGENSNVSLLTLIFKNILSELQDAIEDHIDKGFTPLEIAIPSDMDFYSHPNPQQCFGSIFRSFRREISKQEDWRDVRVVLLIDEFQYIYSRIVDGKIPESFMQSWKAFLQANYFHTVLVGQDVMPKFKARFPNEFGTTQDERVTYLKPDDARRLIDEPIRIGGRQGDSRYREQAIERILDLTAGSPFYIQIICNRLVEYMNVKHAGLVTEADVDQVKNELIRDVNALGLDKFDNLINSGDTSPDAITDEDVIKVLKIIADNSSKTDPCPRDKIVCQTGSPIDTILDDLEKRDVVKRRDQSYQIQVGLFREWLIENG